jgi:hypothetical protein
MSTLPPGSTPDQIDALIRKQFGFEAWALAVPELRTTLENLVQANGTAMDQATIEGAIKATQWWRTQQQTQRAFIQLQNEDPAQAIASQKKAGADIGIQARAAGINLNNDQLYDLGTKSIMYGWDQAMTTAALEGIAAQTSYTAQQAGAADPFAGQYGLSGNLSGNYARIGQLENQYVVKMDDNAKRDYAIQMTMGGMNEAAVTAELAKLAAGRYPAVADQIMAGVTPAQLLANQKATAARLLEVSPDSINFLSDPNMAKIAQYSDPKTGIIRMMTDGETANYVRTLPAWQTTANANQNTAAVMKQVLTGLGSAKF